MRSRVRTRTHGSVGRREPSAPSDPIEQRIKRSDRLPKWDVIIEPLAG